MPPRLGPRALPAALESQLQAQLQQRRIHIDKIAAVVAFLQIAMGALDAVSRSGCRAVLFGSLVLHALQAWVMFGPRAEWYNAYRTLVAATLLVAVRLLTAFSIQGCNNPTSQDDGVTLTFRLLYKTGFVPLVWYYVALPLPFGLSVICHVLSAVLYNRTLVLHACQRVFVLPGDEQLLSGAWRAITLVVGICSPLMGGLLVPREAAGAGASKAAASDLGGGRMCGAGDLSSGGGGGGGGLCPLDEPHGGLCVATMTYAQAVLGVWAPLAASYVFLVRARRRMLWEHIKDSGGGGAAQRRAAGGRPAAPGGRGGAEGGGGAAGADGGGAGGGSSLAAARAALGALHVSPLAVLLATVGVSNVAYWAASQAWHV